MLLEIDRPERIVLLHESNPRFTVTALFEDLGDHTRLTFRQQFESKRDFEIVKSYAGDGNEQNMDRLGELLAKLQE
ncbi:SRPBCC domain-containing protein [Paenibacillus zeirhizosphaerae]|uniref:SRPBCC domain-containing protein n=1 Tax=Paenibacillus zeirhizosphaerae TaxID=2987519 RepID=UPI003520F68A